MGIKRRSKPLYLGIDTENGGRIVLNDHWFGKHLHLLGPPDAGKTRLLLWIFQHLSRNPRATIVLVNPKGALARMARDWAIGHGQSKRLVWFDPGDPQFVVGYNPVWSDRLPVATHAKAVREAIRSAWGQSSFDQTPQLARLLYLALAVSIALNRTLLDALQLLRSGPAGATLRRSLIAGLGNGHARGERDLLDFLANALAWFDALSERRQEELSASALARLESFVSDPAISRILTQRGSLDVGKLIAEHKILLVNLEIGRPLRIDDVKLLGRFIVNDVMNQVCANPTPDEPVYLILDEVQNFATRDLCSILDMGRELGLHCVFAHQHLGQLRGEDETGCLYSSVWGCARTKLYFGGLAVEDLDLIVRDACIGEFDPYKVKDELTTLELDPVESRRDVVARGWNVGISAGAGFGISTSRSRARSRGVSRVEGESSTDGMSIGTASSLGHVSGSQDGMGAGETILPNDEVIQTAHEMTGTSEADIASATESSAETHTEGTHSSVGTHESGTEGEAEGKQSTVNVGVSGGMTGSRTTVPFYEYRKRRQVSSRTFQSEQEFLTTKLQMVKNQPKAHAFVKVPGKAGRFVALPWVRTPRISAKAREAGLERVFKQPFYARPDELEAIEVADELVPVKALDAPEAREAGPAKCVPETTTGRTVPKEGQREESIPEDADENFWGAETALTPRRNGKKGSR